MKFIQPSFEIVTPESRDAGIRMLRQIEHYARISHRSEDKQTEVSWERFIPAIILQHGDWSVAEHCIATVVFKVDRGTTHEIVRHRLFSYTQESTRFVNHGNKEIEFIVPEFAGNEQALRSWENSIAEAEISYKLLRQYGSLPQIARSVLPNAMAAVLAMTGNLRSWRQFLAMRSTVETHPDLRRVVVPLLAEFKNRIPFLYDDIEPLRRQSIAMAANR